ncbi:LicD family protein [Rhodobacteraceae bacterium]|nr:LicD family protein [Paracoccaceae bacterium]
MKLPRFRKKVDEKSSPRTMPIIKPAYFEHASDNQELVLLAQELFPGFGTFGARAPLTRNLAFNGHLKRICLFLDAGSENEYVFPVPRLYGKNGREIPLKDVVESVETSSGAERKKDNAARDALLAGRALPSKRGLRPELTIIFSKPQLLSQIELVNRPGQFGPRNRHLCVNGYYDGKLVLHHRVMDPERMVQELLVMHRDLGLELPREFYDGTSSPKSRKQYCATVRHTILEQISDDRLSLSALQLAHLLPLFENTSKLNDFQIRIAAEVIMTALPSRLSIGTVTFSPLANVMSSPTRIKNVLAEVNSRMTRKLERPVNIVASKHAIQEPVLIRKRDSYLAALDAAFPALSACGVTPMLCYGSLLGAVREQAFLGHDDDVDLLYFDGSTSFDEMMSRRENLVKQLADHGFQTKGPLGKMINFHIQNEEGKLDLFPCWRDGDTLHVMRKYPTFESVPAKIILPASDVQLYDRRYPAPSDPEAFLAWRYGRSWNIPDPYHEWPWPLK